MKQCLIDVLNVRNTLLHVFSIPVEDEEGNPKSVDPQHEALRLAVLLQLVPDREADGLHARPHVSRGGALQPFGDVLRARRQLEERVERHVPRRVNFVPLQRGCPKNWAEDQWQWARAVAVGDTSTLSY